ncbi:hypothetical protein VTK56DRAFT_470 [Thermocarpiscus australiensis]
MAEPLLTTTFLARAKAGEPPATVRIQNLHTPLQHAGRDAWNRAGKPQPCLVSAEVSFRDPFPAAAAHDRLGADTVHYGTLSKAVLASVAPFAPTSPTPKREAGGGRGECTLRDVLETLWADLTRRNLTTGEKVEERPCLVDPTRVRFLSVMVALPKASLLGEGVSLTASGVFDESGRMEARAMALEICRLRVPTLVGVNANERLSKQFVVVTVTIEEFDQRSDRYTEIEGAVVKALEESSFETLEALGVYLADRVLATSSPHDDWQVNIRMEKPTAVPMADCPIVEVRATRESLRRKREGA